VNSRGGYLGVGGTGGAVHEDRNEPQSDLRGRIRDWLPQKGFGVKD
jgi:hypothetical protein